MDVIFDLIYEKDLGMKRFIVRETIITIIWQFAMIFMCQYHGARGDVFLSDVHVTGYLPPSLLPYTPTPIRASIH
jgi:hypothetical protein